MPLMGISTKGVLIRCAPSGYGKPLGNRSIAALKASHASLFNVAASTHILNQEIENFLLAFWWLPLDFSFIRSRKESGTDNPNSTDQQSPNQ
jgi:hypothetical protein